MIFTATGLKGASIINIESVEDEHSFSRGVGASGSLKSMASALSGCSVISRSTGRRAHGGVTTGEGGVVSGEPVEAQVESSTSSVPRHILKDV
jgi:hypothetical protein